MHIEPERCSPEPGPAPREAPETGHFSSEDIDHARDVLNRFFYPVAVGVPDNGGGFGLAMRVIQLGPMTVGALNYASPVTLDVPELDAYHVSIAATGRMRGRQGRHETVAGPGTALIYSPGEKVETLHERHSAEISVKIERVALEEELAALLGHPVEGNLDMPPAMDVSTGPGHSWSRLVRLLRDELAYAESLIHQPLIAEQVRGSVLGGLLLSVPHRYRDQLAGPAKAAPPRAIRRVVEAIHDEPEHPYTVAELARAGGMSVRSLQEGFRRHLGCSPMSYLQKQRLLRAREALREADPLGVTVAAVAHRWGFAHLGRFASAYRRQFGEPPSDTLRRAV